MSVSTVGRASSRAAAIAWPSGGPATATTPAAVSSAARDQRSTMQPEREEQAVRRQDHHDGRRQDHEELPEGEQQQRPDQDAHARLDEPGARHGVRAAGEQRQRQAGQDDEQRRRPPVRQLREPARRDRAVVVGTDVRGHHPEHGEAPGDVDPHDAAHDPDATEPAWTA